MQNSRIRGVLILSILCAQSLGQPQFFNGGGLAGYNFNKPLAPNFSATGSVFGPSGGGPAGFGGGFNYNKPNRFSGSIGASSVPGQSRTFTGSGTANIFSRPNNNLDLNAHFSKTQPHQGNSLTQMGGSLDWHNNKGSSASVGVNNIRGMGSSLDLKGTANIYKSKNGFVNVVGELSKPLSGPGRTNSQIGIQGGFNFR